MDELLKSVEGVIGSPAGQAIVKAGLDVVVTTATGSYPVLIDYVVGSAEPIVSLGKPLREPMALADGQSFALAIVRARPVFDAELIEEIRAIRRTLENIVDGGAALTA